MSTRPKTGVLLVNLGTPDSPSVADVRRYLGEFLSDPRVIDINPVGRWLLLHLIILRFRPKKSAHAYRSIWTEAGSPLLVHSQALTDEVKKRLPELEVELAMRYGSPSIKAGLEALRKKACEHVVMLPMFPQYATSSTGSAIAKLYEEASELWNSPYLSIIPPFFDDEGFIEAFRAVGQPVLNDLGPDHVVFSFHGVPVRHIQKSDESGGQHCLASSSCCDQIVEANRNCYRAQCFSTARILASKLGLSSDQYSISFQSRLGRDPWIQPYTDETVLELAKQGKKRVAVLCPAFVADCLETIEEIGVELEQTFKAAGGTELRLVPSLNASPAWAEAVVELIRKTAGR